jgi:hypothetical protein
MKTTVNFIFAQQEALGRAAFAAGARETQARVKWRLHVQNSDGSGESYGLGMELHRELRSARIEAAAAWDAYNRYVEAAVAALSEQVFDGTGVSAPHVEHQPFHGAIDCPEVCHD